MANHDLWNPIGRPNFITAKKVSVKRQIFSLDGWLCLALSRRAILRNALCLELCGRKARREQLNDEQSDEIG